MKLSKIIKNFELFYPLHLAEDWDNVGLQIGDPNKDVKTILTVLEITEDVIDEAIEKNVDLIICHHPIIFKTIKNMAYNNSHTNKIVTLIKNDIAVYAGHTNVDIARNGMNDWLAEVIGIERVRPLAIEKFEEFLHISIELDKSQMNEVIDLLDEIGSGDRGDVLQKVTVTPTTSFKEFEKDRKVHDNMCIINAFILESEIPVLNKLMKNYNIKHKNSTIFYVSNRTSNMRKQYGIGRLGFIKPRTLESLATDIKGKFDIDGVKIVGSRETIISKVAIVGGSGSVYIDKAIAAKADVLITGDTGYHQAQHALENNICLIDAGHHLEIVFNDIMRDFVSLICDETVLASEIDSNPYEVV
ncbi:Nif3-like dinuclear metal center hexameric protein [Mollicutes bacterium LVI A0039]|nr:Nif3-like dinuclear metal center hexameric protein [Mollicutes bacterium LVI A0039]